MKAVLVPLEDMKIAPMTFKLRLVIRQPPIQIDTLLVNNQALNVNKCCCCFSAGEVNIQAQFEKSSYLPDETI